MGDLNVRVCGAVALAMVGISPAAAQPTDTDAPTVGWFEYLESEQLGPATVESASKREQRLLDASADITVIDAFELQAMGVDSLAEALRRAPGTHVMQLNGNVFSVGLRGVNRLANNQVLVLLDGRPIQDLLQGSPHWGALTTHPGDIERIEVLHGPGSTVYGANAMSGVISMRSKRPLDYVGYEGWFGAGLYGVRDLSPAGDERTRLENNGSGYAAYGWANPDRTVGLRASGGFSSAPEWRDPSTQSIAVHGHYHYYARLAAQYKPDDDLEVFATASVGSSEYENTFAVTSLNFNMKNLEEAFTAKVQRRNLLGFADVTVDVNANYLNGETLGFNDEAFVVGADVRSWGANGTAQVDMRLAGGRNVLTLGVEGGFHEARDMIDIDPGRRHVSGIVQNELQVLSEPRVLLSAGLRAERFATDDGAGTETVYNNAMPRAAIVANFNNEHAVRAAFATSYRTPVPVENYLEFTTIDMDDSGPDAISFTKNLELRPTQVVGGEVGYRGEIRGLLRVSATGFAQRVTDEIGTSNELRLPLRWENLYDINEIGGSAEVEYRPTSASRTWAHYTYTHAMIADTNESYREWPAHIAGAGGVTSLPHDVLLSGHVSVWSSIAPDTIIRSGDVLDYPQGEVKPQAIGTLRVSRAIAGGNGEIFLGLRNVGALLRERENTRQFTGELVQPIGSSIMIGMILSEGRGR